MGAGCWVMGVGCWVMGVGCWVMGKLQSKINHKQPLLGDEFQ